jgi:hypothetical protein
VWGHRWKRIQLTLGVPRVADDPGALGASRDIVRKNGEMVVAVVAKPLPTVQPVSLEWVVGSNAVQIAPSVEAVRFAPSSVQGLLACVAVVSAPVILWSWS